MAQLVGRANELSQAHTVLLRASRRGDGGVILVTGAAGIGKTAFARAVAEQAAELGYAAGIGKAEEIGQIAPGAPLLIALRSGARPLLSAGEFGSLAPLHGEPLWLVDRIADLLEEHAQRAPILIVIDDCQWADPLSRFALRALAGRLIGLPVVWLLASRGDARELADDLSGSAIEQLTTQAIALDPLSQADIDSIAARILGTTPTGETQRRLRGTGGNPFLAVQFAAAVSSAGDATLPTTLVAAVRTRLSRLSPPVQQLLEIVALWGCPLDVRDAGALLAGEPTDQPADPLADEPTDQLASDLAASIAEAVAADLLIGSRPQITMRHDLIREAVYEGIPGAVRVALHRKCAEYLLGTGHGALAAAPHMQASARPGDERAVTVLRDAAAECRLAEPGTAALLLGQAFALLPPGHPARPQIGEQYAGALADAQHGSDVITVVDTLLLAVTDAEARARLQVIAARALWLAGSPGQIIGRVDATVSDPRIPAVLRTRLAAFRALASTRVHTAEAASLAAHSALSEGRRLTDHVAEHVALQALGEIARNELRHEDALSCFRALRQPGSDQHLAQEVAALRLLDRFDEAEAVMNAASQAADGNGDAAQPSLTEARMWQDFMLGRFDEADAGARTLARLSDELGTSTYRLETAMTLTLTALMRGDTTRARELLDQAERDDRSDQLVRSPRLALVRSLLAALDGRPDEGVRIIKPVMSTASSTRSYWPRLPEWMRVHAGMAIAAGDRDFGRETVVRATSAAERNPGSASLVGIALQVQGLIDGDADLLAKAVDRLEASPRVMLLASALADYGALLLAHGDQDRGDQDRGDQARGDPARSDPAGAAAALRRACSLYDKHGAVTLAAAAARLLRGAGVAATVTVSPRRPDQGWGALTAAELAVAESISAGHTNRGAARALGISSNTVATHLRSIFAKLDIQSRVQLANAWHAQHRTV
jgi:DNA-binding CsgD family transcriptional regulator/tetratricopeptide (TPR) repeat protein